MHLPHEIKVEAEISTWKRKSNHCLDGFWYISGPRSCYYQRVGYDAKFPCFRFTKQWGWKCYRRWQMISWTWLSSANALKRLITFANCLTYLKYHSTSLMNCAHYDKKDKITSYHKAVKRSWDTCCSSFLMRIHDGSVGMTFVHQSVIDFWARPTRRECVHLPQVFHPGIQTSQARLFTAAAFVKLRHAVGEKGGGARLHLAFTLFVRGFEFARSLGVTIL